MHVWWTVSFLSFFLYLQENEVFSQRIGGMQHWRWPADTSKSSSWKCDNKSPVHCLVNSRWNLILASALMNPPVPSESLQQQVVNFSSSIPAAQSLFIENPIWANIGVFVQCNDWSRNVCPCVCVDGKEHGKLFEPDTGTRKVVKCYVECMFYVWSAQLRFMQLQKKKKKIRLLIIVLSVGRKRWCLNIGVLVWKDGSLWENHNFWRSGVPCQHCGNTTLCRLHKTNVFSSTDVLHVVKGLTWGVAVSKKCWGL